MRPGAIFDNLGAFTQELLSQYGVEEVSHFTDIPAEDLVRWQQGGNHYIPKAEWKLFGFCVTRQAFSLLRRFTSSIPTFDMAGKNVLDSFDLHTPPLGFD